ELQDDAEEDAGEAEDEERRAPPEAQRQERRDGGAADGADVDAGLVQPEGARAGARVVVVADERDGRREVRGLPKPLGRAQRQERTDARRERGGDADEAPDLKPAQERDAAPYPIHKPPRK